MSSFIRIASHSSRDQVNSQHNQLQSLSIEQQEVVETEETHLQEVIQALHKDLRDFEGVDGLLGLDDDLLALRDQIQEARAEDRPALIAHMSRLAALQSARSSREQEASDDELFSSPYFARIAYHEENEDGEATGRTRIVFIGKRSFFSEDGHIKVIDWRSSPMSKLYYTLREGDYFYEEVGSRIVTGTLTTRRMLTINHSKLRRIQYGALGDQLLQCSRDGQWTSGMSSLARLEGGERSASRITPHQANRRGALPDITALIDPDQFSLITGGRSGVVIIQGGAGTGKTTIALHRVAYLRFQNPERFQPSRCLIIAPGEALKRYVEQSLPSLELTGVKVDTLGSWSLNVVKRLIPRLKRFKLHDETSVGASRIKRHPLILKLIEHKVRDEARAQEPLIKRLGGVALLDEWVRRRSLPLVERIKKTRQFAHNHKLLTHVDLRDFEKMVADLTDPFSTWLTLLTDVDQLRDAFRSRKLPIAEWELKQLKESVYEQSLSRERFDYADADYQVGIDHKALESSPLRERLDTEDCVILLRICQVKWGKLAGPRGQISYEHITVDEAQDLSPTALRTLCDATPDHAPVTLAGDTAQRVVFDNGFQTWHEALTFLPKRTKLLPPLTISYRSTRQVMHLARHLLGDLVHSWESRDFREGAPVGFLRFEESGEGVAFLGEALNRVMNMEPDATVAVVARDQERARHYYELLRRANIPKLRLVVQQDFPFTSGIDLTEVRQIKGLEYDYVIALDIDAQSYPARDEARHLLHVVATRAAHQLWLMCIGQLSPSPLLPKELIDSGELSPPESKG